MIRTAGYTAPIRDAWRFTNQANSFQNLMVTANVCMCGIGRHVRFDGRGHDRQFRRRDPRARDDAAAPTRSSPPKSAPTSCARRANIGRSRTTSISSAIAASPPSRAARGIAPTRSCRTSSPAAIACRGRTRSSTRTAPPTASRSRRAATARQLAQGGGVSMPTIEADPYPWPYNGDLRPDNTALIIIDMQTDFCGEGGYVDKMGYDLSLTRAPIEPIKALLAAMRAKGYHDHPHARGPSPRPRRPARQQALALAPHRRRHRRPRPLRQDPRARRAGLGDHRRTRAAAGRDRHRQARQGLVLRDRPRTDPAHARHREPHADRHHHRRLRPHDDARGQRSRLRVPAAGGLLRRDRSRQPSRRDQDGEDAGRRVRRGRRFEGRSSRACRDAPRLRRIALPTQRARRRLGARGGD